MIRRWTRFVAGSYPPLPSVLFALAWSYGVTGLFAAVQPGSRPWRPAASTALAAAALVVTLLLMRAVDDIRDLDYDRSHNPERPLASGAVSVRDLLALYAAGSVVVLALNAGSPAALEVLAAQLGYCLLVLAVDRRFRWPSGDKLLLSLVVSFPGQLLLHLYLYAVYLHGAGLKPNGEGALAIVIVVLASAHLELGKKITRRPKAGERTYVNVFGLNGTVRAALAAPLLSAALLVAGAHSAPALVPVAVLPLALPALAWWRFRDPAVHRWPGAAPALYLLAAFACYLAIGLATG